MRGDEIKESPCKDCQRPCPGNKGCLIWLEWFKKTWREVVKLFDHVEWVKKNDE